jgi:4-hydroxy-2-oxoheptanedioate aldolase
LNAVATALFRFLTLADFIVLLPELSLAARLSRGESVNVCAVGRILHHNLVQMLAMSGTFQGFWFDMEHTDFATADLEIGILAARAHGCDSFVRMPMTNYAAVTRVLEAGAGGVMAAQIKTVDEAREFVRWAKFAPMGVRGLNTMGYDADFGKLPAKDFLVRANQRSYVAIQIETVEALECVEQIAALEGVDFLFVGPADLSVNLGVPGDFLNPKCRAALERVGRACKAQGKTWGVVPFGPEHTRVCVDNGCRMLSIAADVRVVNLGLAALAAQVQAGT